MALHALTLRLNAHMQSWSGGDRRQGMELLQAWLKRSLPSWSAPLRQRWGLDRSAEMDLSRYPVDEATLDLDDELRRLTTVPPSSLEQLAMRVRDILWAGVTVHSGVDCPRCRDDQLRILEHPPSDAIVLACDRCTWAQTPDGEPWSGAGFLEPATTERIARSAIRR